MMNCNKYRYVYVCMYILYYGVLLNLNILYTGYFI